MACLNKRANLVQLEAASVNSALAVHGHCDSPLPLCGTFYLNFVTTIVICLTCIKENFTHEVCFIGMFGELCGNRCVKNLVAP